MFDENYHYQFANEKHMESLEEKVRGFDAEELIFIGQIVMDELKKRYNYKPVHPKDRKEEHLAVG